MLSYPDISLHVYQHNNGNVHQQQHTGIQKSLQNTSPRGVNAAVKSVIRLLVSSKVQNSSAIYLSIRGDIDLGGGVL